MFHKHTCAPLMIALLVILAGVCGGCAAASWLAVGVTGGKRKVAVDAEYTGLENKTVAVMVSADSQLQFIYPKASELVARTVTRELTENVAGIVVKNPLQVVSYQKANPNWPTVPYAELIEAMDVDRLIIVDLIDYRTHEPGNRHLWQGVITANVGVVEREAADPDSFAFYQNVAAVFPEDNSVGVVNASDEEIQLGMLTIFGRKTGQLFYDHEKEVPI